MQAVDILSAYLRRHAAASALGHRPVHPELGLVVVIPCRDEPDLRPTLQSLRACAPPDGAVEVLVIANASEHDDADLRARNRASLEGLRAWRRAHEHPRFRVHALDFPHLPARRAGVGLARKLGMDEAVARLRHAGRPRGIIASLDADCGCDDNYLRSLESHFREHPRTRACSIYFEHDLVGPQDAALYDAITHYELHIRYYRHGLLHAGFPYAHYTLGSCFAVRADHYARHGGMNRRTAGEDFYFLNKLMAVGGVSENRATRVRPGVRAQARTPFGTGRALRDWMSDGRAHMHSYDPRVFRDLAALVAGVDAGFWMAPGEWRAPAGLSRCMRGFLLARGMRHKHAELRANCASAGSYRKRFFQWFDGLGALKFIHHASACAYPRQRLEHACRTLLQWQGVAAPPAGAPELLACLRHRDRLPVHARGSAPGAADGPGRQRLPAAME